MNKKLEQRIEKLPQWAQRYIGKLQRDNAGLAAERGKIACGNAKITFGILFGEDYGIPDRATVTFRVDRDAIEFSLRDDEVRARSASGCLVIEPAASNAVNISVRR